MMDDLATAMCINCNVFHDSSSMLTFTLSDRISPDSLVTVSEAFQLIFTVPLDKIKSGGTDSESNTLCHTCFDLLQSCYQTRSEFLSRSSCSQRVHQVLSAGHSIEKHTDNHFDSVLKGHLNAGLQNELSISGGIAERVKAVEPFEMISELQDKDEFSGPDSEYMDSCWDDQATESTSVLGEFQAVCTTEKIFKCKICNATFHWEAYYLVHLQVDHHETRVGEEYQCALCSHVDLTRAHLEWHYCICHTKETPYHCSQCSFSSIDELKEHVRNYHGTQNLNGNNAIEDSPNAPTLTIKQDIFDDDGEDEDDNNNETNITETVQSTSMAQDGSLCDDNWVVDSEQFLNVVIKEDFVFGEQGIVDDIDVNDRPSVEDEITQLELAPPSLETIMLQSVRKYRAKVSRYQYHCSVCNGRFKWEGFLLYHQQTKHDSVRRVNGKIGCNIAKCQFCCIKPHDLLKHCFTHTRETLCCPFESCDFMTKSYQRIVTHERTVHFTDSNRYCYGAATEKKQTHNSLQDEEEQQRTSLGVHDLMFKCKICPKRFEFESDLLFHEHTHTVNSSKVLKCNICSYYAPSCSVLARHLFSHTKERPFRCRFPGCNYSTTRRNLFHEHLKMFESHNVQSNGKEVTNPATITRPDQIQNNYSNPSFSQKSNPASQHSPSPNNSSCASTSTATASVSDLSTIDNLLTTVMTACPFSNIGLNQSSPSDGTSNGNSLSGNSLKCTRPECPFVAVSWQGMMEHLYSDCGKM